MNADRLIAPKGGVRRYAAVNVCIYCGKTADLSDEHVVPFGLGGNIVLPKASCSECAQITSRLERTVMRGPMRPVRVVRGIQSRRRHKDAPTTLPLRVRRNGEWETISLTYEEYPIILEAFVFSVPRILDPTYTHGTRVRGHWSLLFGPHPNEVKQKLGANEISAPRTYDPSALARMTAKTAYAFAVAEGAIDPRRGKPLVVNSILGREDQVGRGIGTVREPRQIGQGVLQDLTLQIDPRTQSLIARVNFLADVGAPTYGVKLGVATEKYCNTTFVQQPSNSRDIEWMTAAVPGDVLNALASAT